MIRRGEIIKNWEKDFDGTYFHEIETNDYEDMYVLYDPKSDMFYFLEGSSLSTEITEDTVLKLLQKGYNYSEEGTPNIKIVF